MSECHLSAEIYIKNNEDRDQLIQFISKKNKEVELFSETLHIKSLLIDEVISINGMTGGQVSLDIEFKKWVKKFKPDIVLICVDFEEDEVKFGLLGNKKVAYKKALDLLKGVSKRIETGITMEGSESSILAYLEENIVSPLETFQGIKHVDRVIVNREWKAIDYFIERGLDPNHIVRDHETSSVSYDYLIHRCISYDEGLPLLRKCIANGADVNVLDHNKHNLLHLRDYSNKKLLQEFIRAGINVNQLDKECRTPLLYITKDFFESCDPSNDFDEFYFVFEMLIKAGAEPYIFDKYGAGILLYARNYPDIQKKLLTKWPDLKIHDPEQTYDTAVSSLFRASRLRKKFYDICISESVFQPFFDDSFIEFINKASHTRSPEMELDILKNAMHIMKLACSVDNLDIVKRVESLNLPLNMPVEIGTTLFEESQKNSSKQIYSYLQKNQCTDDTSVNFRASLEKCIEEAETEGKHGNAISEYYSKSWKKQIEIERDRAIGWGSTSVESTLDNYIRKEFMDFMTLNKTPLISCVWGSDVYIDFHKRQGAMIVDGKVILVTPAEALKNIGVNVK